MIFRKLARYKELVILLTAGLFIIFIIDMVLVQGFHKDEHYRENLMAERLQAQVQSSLEEHVTALIALKVVYQNFTDITHYDFQQYGKSITSTLHGFQRLMYVDPSMTIRQVYPLSPENTGLYGYSLTKQPDMAMALGQARLAKSTTTSRLISFLNHPKSFWAIIPVFRNNNKDFLGFAAGEISLEKIWQPLGQSFSQYQIQLIDPEGSKLFQQVNINSNSPSVSRFKFNILGQDWSIELNPINRPAQTLLIQRGSLWVGGLLILALMTMIVLNTKRHKLQLEDAHKQFETMFEASPDGILLLDDKLNLKISNPVVQEWLGKGGEDLSGQNFFDLFECQCPNLKKCSEFNHLLCTSKEFAADLPDVLETQIIDPPTGNLKTLRLNASRITLEQEAKKEQGFICVLGDISTSKELDRVKETYVATLTHDLKTPLLAQQMVLETLGAGNIGPINEDQKRLLFGAKDSVQDLLDMVNSTLLFYKLESSHVTLHRQHIQLANLAKDVMSGLQPLAEKREINFTLDAALDLPDAWIDPVQMKRVFHNILSNAISYGKKNTPIRVSISQVSQDDLTESRLMIEIANSGKGIASEDLQRIFDKYYSLSRKFKQIGTGLGLYISKRIVELHGGKIWAVSEPDKETRFLISLPVVQHVEKVASHGSNGKEKGKSKTLSNVTNLSEKRLPHS